MQVTFQPTTAQRLFVALLTTVLFATATFAQSDEQTIRNLVQQESEGKKVFKWTDEMIHVTGAYPKPFVGKAAWEAAMPQREKVNSERKNFLAKHDIVRLEFAGSKDMAYEYGNANISWDAPDGKHVSRESSYVRIWRKVGNEWLIEVFFARPNE